MKMRDAGYRRIRTVFDSLPGGIFPPLPGHRRKPAAVICIEDPEDEADAVIAALLTGRESPRLS